MIKIVLHELPDCKYGNKLLNKLSYNLTPNLTFSVSNAKIENPEKLLFTNLVIADYRLVDDKTIEVFKMSDRNILVYNEKGRIRELSNIVRPICCPYKWARRVKRGEPYYECSSRGDKKYSAVFARIKKYNNKSIEEIYQLDIKGYRKLTNDWREAKGKPPLVNKTEEELFQDYVKLWEEYFKENPNLLEEIRIKAIGKTITDMFGVTPINQARAICYILNNYNECKE